MSKLSRIIARFTPRIVVVTFQRKPVDARQVVRDKCDQMRMDMKLSTIKWRLS